MDVLRSIASVFKLRIDIGFPVLCFCCQSSLIKTISPNINLTNSVILMKKRLSKLDTMYSGYIYQ